MGTESDADDGLNDSEDQTLLYALHLRQERWKRLVGDECEHHAEHGPVDHVNGLPDEEAAGVSEIAEVFGDGGRCEERAVVVTPKSYRPVWR